VAGVAYRDRVDAVHRLRGAASAEGLVDEDGEPVALDLRPGLDPAAIQRLQAAYDPLGVPLPRELTRLLAVTTGTDALLDLDLTGERHSVEASELLPAGLPVAADGFGNFWLLDLTPDTVETAPVFFACHDAPVLIYQAASLAEFVDLALRALEPVRDTTIDDVHEDRLFQVGRRAPHSMSWQSAMSSDDHALRDFAASLDEAWTVVDLRRREVGMGVPWGAHGPRTRLARHGWERIFGFAPPARDRRSIWSRMSFADPTMGIRPVRSRSRARRTGRPAPPPP
jgi:cell wall assembly regulator SMI1